jgi:hypothetical protein
MGLTFRSVLCRLGFDIAGFRRRRGGVSTAIVKFGWLAGWLMLGRMIMLQEIFSILNRRVCARACSSADNWPDTDPSKTQSESVRASMLVKRNNWPDTTQSRHNPREYCRVRASMLVIHAKQLTRHPNKTQSEKCARACSLCEINWQSRQPNVS